MNIFSLFFVKETALIHELKYMFLRLDSVASMQVIRNHVTLKKIIHITGISRAHKIQLVKCQGLASYSLCKH